MCRVPLAGKTVSAAHGTAMEAVDENSEHGDVEITEAVSKKLLFDHCSDCVETHNAILSNKSDVKSQTMDHLDSKMVDSQFESRTDDASGDRTEEKGYLLQKDEVCEAKDSLYQMNYHDKESESKSEVYSVG